MMPGRSPVNRRFLLAGAASSMAVLPIAARSQTVLRIRSVRVDASRLAAIGGRAAADVVVRVLPAKLAASFADLTVAGDASAPVLVARIDTLFLSSFGDAPGVDIDALGHQDTMEGAGLLVAGARVLSTTPLRVNLPAGYSGAYYLPDIDVRRITSLCESFASWLRREMVS